MRCVHHLDGEYQKPQYYFLDLEPPAPDAIPN